ncbi:ubiquinone/menaquinone biosynthesis methyltransferase [Ruania zhangjianzhongii]|uniref:ubiquinone/menaquinone biosynthesis methyltransferase n=1 Tax=Ruania zhangjianzhongii TaxID=2603206 RepID=UPI0011CAE136|nr:ubiquinone/menaquinone biosynthesis methyltransferase [Ruania zhangjianzhongii]
MSATSEPSSHGEDVRQMFDAITADYDRMNAVMTLGRHAAWCTEVARRAQLPADGHLLDLATGTGVIAQAARRLYPSAQITAGDFSQAMLDLAARRPAAESITWEPMDANSLRFDDESFDAVTQGYLLRNVEDVAGVLREQYRVLRPGGRVVVLETCPPRGILKLPVALGMRTVIPLAGRLLAGNKTAYSYLARTSLGFARPEQVAATLEGIGFTDVGWRRRFLTTNMIIWARKPGSTPGSAAQP